jgi:hypothetical protein
MLKPNITYVTNTDLQLYRNQKAAETAPKDDWGNDYLDCTGNLGSDLCDETENCQLRLVKDFGKASLIEILNSNGNTVLHAYINNKHLNVEIFRPGFHGDRFVYRIFFTDIDTRTWVVIKPRYQKDYDQHFEISDRQFRKHFGNDEMECTWATDLDEPTAKAFLESLGMTEDTTLEGQG